VLDERTESDTIMDVYFRSEKRRNEKVKAKKNINTRMCLTLTQIFT